MKKLLFVNACVNRGRSRTCRIGRGLVALLGKKDDYDVSELVLEEENLQALTSETLNGRFELAAKKDFSGEIFRYARRFREADCIVIAAPYWDLGFPAMLKIYIETVSIPGLMYRYGDDDRSTGLCRAEKLYYVTTRGGHIGDERDLGYATMLELGKLYGIGEVKCISVNGLDIPVNDVETAVQKAIDRLPDRL
ncbi:MAG: NAD(P)H-dependent oxidoreductase [Tannerella sp.]|jgi:FMN-dependent NADH-azoreductase|nr:NAD(P)H-dependent oxidoreductase [Tannerella sp.]